MVRIARIQEARGAQAPFVEGGNDFEHRLVHSALGAVELGHGVGEVVDRCGGEE